MVYSAYQNIPNMASSSLYLTEYDQFYPYDVYRTQDFQFGEINPVSPQTNDSKFEHSNFNRCSDSDSFHSGSGSRPSSTQLYENETDSHFCSMDDATYLLSLPNRSDWTLASSNIRHSTSSPASSSYTDSRSSPMITDISLYEDVEQTYSSRGRRTPPPPYRPPVKTDIMSENTPLKTISSDIFKPPPPYTRTLNNNTCSSINNRHSGFPVESSISGNFPLTADRNQSPVSTSDNWWMLPMPNGFQPGGFGEQTTVGGETSTEVLVPADPELWNKEHINHWLTKVENYYGIGHIDRTHMPEDGSSLCCLSVDDFHQITGDRKTAEILSNYMDCVKQSIHFSSKSTRQNTGGNEKNATTFFEAVKHIVGKSSSKNKSSSPSGGGQIQLWQFLLELLVDPRHSSLITWEDEDGTFRFLDPEGTAKLWGERKFKETKSKKPMNYDKLSRSLRHYYMKGIINKVSGRKYTYKFYLDGVIKACSPSGISDSLFIYPNFDPNSCDDNSPRNFNLNLR